MRHGPGERQTGLVLHGQAAKESRKSIGRRDIRRAPIHPQGRPGGCPGSFSRWRLVVRSRPLAVQTDGPVDADGSPARRAGPDPPDTDDRRCGAGSRLDRHGRPRHTTPGNRVAPVRGADPTSTLRRSRGDAATHGARVHHERNIGILLASGIRAGRTREPHPRLRVLCLPGRLMSRLPGKADLRLLPRVRLVHGMQGQTRAVRPLRLMHLYGLPGKRTLQRVPRREDDPLPGMQRDRFAGFSPGKPLQGLQRNRYAVGVTNRKRNHTLALHDLSWHRQGLPTYSPELPEMLGHHPGAMPGVFGDRPVPDLQRDGAPAALRDMRRDRPDYRLLPNVQGQRQVPDVRRRGRL